MRILIVGAGAIGGYFGARLLQAGAHVTFLVRAGRAAVLAQQGLHLDSALGNVQMPVQTVLQSGVAPEYDLVIVASKTYDLASVMDDIAPAITGATAILPFVNGLRAYDLLDERFGKDRVLGGVAYIAVSLEDSGRIQHIGTGDNVITGARMPSQQATADAFHVLLATTPGERRQSSDITQALWDKWIAIAAGAAMTCLMRGTVGDILACPHGEIIMHQAIAECTEVATAAGHALGDAALTRMDTLLLDLGSTWAASMMRDMHASGKPTEADDILGDLLHRAQHHRIDVPLLRIANCHMQVYERQRVQAAK